MITKPICLKIYLSFEQAEAILYQLQAQLKKITTKSKQTRQEIDKENMSAFQRWQKQHKRK